jgi:hypothetical protein
MKDEQDYIKDITEMRSMMERSSRFMSLAGLAGVMAGIYALAGAWIVYSVLDFHPDQLTDATLRMTGTPSAVFLQVMLVGFAVLVLSVGTAIVLSRRKAGKRQEKFYTSSTRRYLVNMALPLVAGGLLILVLIAHGMTGLVAPLTLLFYGLALVSASNFTYEEVRSLGIIQIVLGLIGSWFIPYGLICWALGFGVVHIIYGIYMHYKYER